MDHFSGGGPWESLLRAGYITAVLFATQAKATAPFLWENLVQLP